MRATRAVLVAEIDSEASTASFPERSQPGLSRALAGGKGHSLAELARAGFAIPRTLVFTTRLFEAHVAACGAAPFFRRLSRELEAGRRPPASLVRRARRVLEREPLAPALEAPVLAALEKLLAVSASGRVALRSSATGEDRAHATFAGLHDSFLGLATLAEARRALRACWLSLLSDRALEYRARLRLRSPLAMAVVAQEHVRAKAAGVAFSCVGRADAAQVVVELAPPGESAPVTGAVTPERFSVPRVPGGGASKGDIRLAAAPLARWLTADQAIDVVRQALHAEELLQGPADVEWLLALEPAGARPRSSPVVLVQARPARPARRPRFDRTAVAESLPGALAPLARDLVVRAYSRAFAKTYLGAPPVLTDQILVYAGGRLFMDTVHLDLAVACAARRPGRDAREARVREQTEARLAASVRRLRDIASSARAIRRATPRALPRIFEGILARAERELDALLPLYLLAQDDVALVQDAIARTRARLELPLGTPPALDAGALDLARALARAAAPLARGRRDHPAVRDLLERFGHRGGVELDLASPPLGEDADGLVALAMQARAQKRRARRPESLPGFRHPALRGLLEHGRGAAARADRLRDAVTLAVRAARRAALALGDSLAALGTLAARDDVFLLAREELARLARGQEIRGLARKVSRRRRALERDRARLVPLTSDRPGRDGGLAAPEPSPGETAAELRGIAASGGLAHGPARVVHRPEDLRGLEAHEVLVAHAATAELFGALVACAGLVTDVGGLLSHGAILARELGVPAVVATEQASRRIATGDLVRVDGERGVVTVERRAPRAERKLARPGAR